MVKLKKSNYLIIRNDDPCALSDFNKEKRILKIFEKYEIKQVVCVIPSVVDDPHNSESRQYYDLSHNSSMTALLKEYAGKGLIEIAQHGYTHQTNTLHPSVKREILSDEYYQGIDRKWLPFSPQSPEWYSEFRGLNPEDQKVKIANGKKILEDAFEMDVSTFSFPWDNFDHSSLQVLKEAQFNQALISPENECVNGLSFCDYAATDIFELPRIMDEAKKTSDAVLTHIEYHSWMLDNKDLPLLDDILADLAKNNDFKVIFANQMEDLCPELSAVMPLKRELKILQKQVGELAGITIYLSSLTVLNPDYYRNRILALKIIRAVLIKLKLAVVINFFRKKDSVQ